jgi:gamma-glutamylcyclotransferase (GGCT)/AIG2-like uncharacterized protein YtfP
MNKLFIYGTLINPEIQKSILGRIINGIPNILEGYEKSEIEIDNKKYPIIIPNKNKTVNGFVIEISDDEFKKIDEYEGIEYKRIEVVLKSGMLAWAYVKYLYVRKS